ncbi:hypothetical protein ACXYMU_13455 [Pontibacter sp. CAU 1760]
MKVTSKFKTIGMALALGAFTVACSQETVEDTNNAVDEAQVEMSEENMEANNNLREFDAWVDNNANRAETMTEEEFREARTEYRRREAEFERESATWDDETKREWEEMKRSWNDLENSVQRRLGNIEDVDVDVNVEKERQ